MGKIRKSKPEGFTIVSNSLISEATLSYKAKGIYSYLWSQGDEWDFYVKEIASRSTDGVDAVRSGLKELEEAGYLLRERANNGETGRIEYDYIIYESPYRENPHTDNPVTDKSNANNKQPITITNSNNNITPPPSGDSMCSSSKKNTYSEVFEKFWEYYGRKGNKKKAFAKWKKLTEAQKAEIESKIAAYIAATPDRQFRKDAQTYLNPDNEHWNDELVAESVHSPTQPTGHSQDNGEWMRKG